MTESKHGLVWIDLEMTGLDPDRDRIIEIATIITDRQLETIAIGPVLALQQSEFFYSDDPAKSTPPNSLVAEHRELYGQ